LLFTSLEFLLFLAAIFAVYYLIPPRFQKHLQWVVLLIASGIFYYLTGVTNLAYLGLTIVTTYAAATLIQRINSRTKPDDKESAKAFKKANKRQKMILLTICLLVNFGLLAFVKFSEVLVPEFLGILGISFYIFRSMSYVIDLHRGKFTHQRNPLKFALYVSFFPVILQGPITRYDESGVALFRGNRFDFRNFSFGLQRILWGFFKKLIIADRLTIALVTLIQDPAQYRGIYALLAFFFYAIVLYADFTGGIDITIGVGQALGIPMKENFMRPFYARNIAEYWRRWHITMGEWFRDYLFYPLSTSKPMLKFAGFLRKTLGTRGEFGKGLARRLPVHIATMIAWFATGVWHGVSWNFITWGLVNGAVIVISLELESPLYKRFGERFPKLTASRFWLCVQILRTFWLMNFIRAFDLYSVRTTVGLQLSVFTDFGWRRFMSDLRAYPNISDDVVGFLGLTHADYIVIAAAIAVLFVASYVKHKTGGVRERLATLPMPLRFAVYGFLLAGILIFGAYGIGYDANQFIYTRF
jgi:D-alanyl-lipoteichoic acid acyltransferase DltB (MBOAT superfamily)